MKDLWKWLAICIGLLSVLLIYSCAKGPADIGGPSDYPLLAVDEAPVEMPDHQFEEYQRMGEGESLERRYNVGHTQEISRRQDMSQRIELLIPDEGIKDVPDDGRKKMPDLRDVPDDGRKKLPDLEKDFPDDGRKKFPEIGRDNWIIGPVYDGVKPGRGDLPVPDEDNGNVIDPVPDGGARKREKDPLPEHYTFRDYLPVPGDGDNWVIDPVYDGVKPGRGDLPVPDEDNGNVIDPVPDGGARKREKDPLPEHYTFRDRLPVPERDYVDPLSALMTKAYLVPASDEFEATGIAETRQAGSLKLMLHMLPELEDDEVFQCVIENAEDRDRLDCGYFRAPGGKSGVPYQTVLTFEEVPSGKDIVWDNVYIYRKSLSAHKNTKMVLKGVFVKSEKNNDPSRD
jgi:hypothetical protein